WPLNVLTEQRPYFQFHPILNRSRYTSLKGRNLGGSSSAFTTSVLGSGGSSLSSDMRWRFAGRPSSSLLSSASSCAGMARMLTGRDPLASCRCLVQSRSRFRSRRGNPQPHSVHFLSMCCLHMRCHTTSSSASALHRRLTCAALHRDDVSR